MPGQIPDPSVTAGSLPSLGPLAGLSATTMTDQLRFGDLQDFGTMLSPLHFLDKLGKGTLSIKAEVWGAGEHGGGGYKRELCHGCVLRVSFSPLPRETTRWTVGNGGERKTKWLRRDVGTKRRRGQTICKW